MMRMRYLVQSCVTCLALCVASVASAAPGISLTYGSDAVGVGDPFELQINLNRSYANPFDSDEISVDAIIVRPSGAIDRHPAYFSKNVVRLLDGSHEVLGALGLGAFALRYAPMEVGAHQVSIVARDDTGTGSSFPITFYARPSSNAGFIRVDPKDPFSFAFDDSSSFVPFGANVAWSREPLGSYDIAAYYKSLEASGSNWSRLWLTHYGEGFSLEWNAKHSSGYYAGLGRFSQELASRLDWIFEEAQRRHIFLQVVLWQHAQFETDKWSSWKDNPYNSANGGPASSSADFFSSKVVAAHNRKLIRYLVARYSAFRSLFAWEVMNEMDGVHAPFNLVASWSEARARDLRALDSYHHLVTTSVAHHPSSSPELFRSDAYDVAQLHLYDPHFDASLPRMVDSLRAYGKPSMLCEFGLDPEGILEARYPQGAHLRQASLLSVASGLAGGAMSWWWDDYLRPRELWWTQSPAATAVSMIDLRGLHDSVLGRVSARDSAGCSMDVFGRRSDSASFLYLRHPSAAWNASDRVLAPVDVTLSFDTQKDARIQLQTFDAHSGAQVFESVVRSDHVGAAVAILPSFAGELLVYTRVVGIEPESDEVQVSGGCAACRSSAIASGEPIGYIAVLGLVLACRRRSVRRLRGRRCRAYSGHPWACSL